MVPAATLAILLSIDTLKTCVVLDTLTMSRHNSNRELLGQGVANVASALVGGMAGSGCMGPTLVNLQSGGRTSRSGICEGFFALAAVLLLGQWIAWTPIAALAGILIVVAIRMFDWNSFNLLRYRATLFDFAVVAAVVIVAVTYDLIAASATGLVLAILLFVREQTRTPVIYRQSRGDRVFSKQQRLPAEQAILEKHGAQTTVCELEGSLFFGTTDQLFTEIEPALKECRYLILDMRRVRSVDFTAAHLLERFEKILMERNGFLIFTHLAANLPGRRNLQAYFKQVGVTKPEDNVIIIETLDDALRWCENRILAEYYPHPPGADKPLSLQETELFKKLPDQIAIDALAARMKELSFAPNEVILKTGHRGDQLFFIRRGTVRIVMRLETGGYHNLASFGPGDFFGELAFLDAGTRTAEAVAETDVQLFAISREVFDAICREYPEAGTKMMTQLARGLAYRLRRADAELEALHEL
jgi:SulP family sulfate permease